MNICSSGPLTTVASTMSILAGTFGEFDCFRLTMDVFAPVATLNRHRQPCGGAGGGTFSRYSTGRLSYSAPASRQVLKSYIIPHSCLVYIAIRRAYTRPLSWVDITFTCLGARYTMLRSPYITIVSSIPRAHRRKTDSASKLGFTACVIMIWIKPVPGISLLRCRHWRVIARVRLVNSMNV